MSCSDQICPFFVVVVVVDGVFVNLIHFIFFSRTTEPISTKLGTKHPWLKGIQTGYNYNIAKIHCRNLKIFFSKTTGTISTKLRHKAFLGKGDSGSPSFSKGSWLRYSKNKFTKFEMFFSRSTLGILGWRAFKFVQMKDSPLFRGR